MAHRPILIITSGFALLVFASYGVLDIVKETNALNLAPSEGLLNVY